MKFNKILLIIAFAAISQSVFAAKTTVYNGTNSSALVAFDGTRPQTVRSGETIVLDTKGASSFSVITWILQSDPGTTYRCSVSCPPLMLNGVAGIYPYPKGTLKMNFDANGASSKKVIEKSLGNGVYATRPSWED
jgi:hypothetical protein